MDSKRQILEVLSEKPHHKRLILKEVRARPGTITNSLATLTRTGLASEANSVYTITEKGLEALKGYVAIPPNRKPFQENFDLDWKFIEKDFPCQVALEAQEFFKAQPKAAKHLLPIVLMWLAASGKTLKTVPMKQPTSSDLAKAELIQDFLNKLAEITNQ